MNKNLDDLLRNKPLLFDGAMGTEIQKRGLKQGSPPELMNLDNPDAVKEIHSNYILSGANVIETNTFGANRVRLKGTALEGKIREVNLSAASIALSVPSDYAAGSVGPLGGVLEPFGDISFSEAEEIFTEQISALLEGGMELILIETMMSLDEALIALKVSKMLNAPVTGVTMTFNITGDIILTSFGESLELSASSLIDNGADFIGSNCGNGFDNMLTIGRRLRDISKVPVLLQPNAGLPVIEDNKLIYKGSPAEYGEFALKSAEYGIEFIGGCCGTSYEHIRTASLALKRAAPANKKL